MKIYLFNHDYRFAAEQILLTMFPEERPEYPDGQPEGDRAELYLFEGRKFYTAVCRLFLNGTEYTGRSKIGTDKTTDELTTTRCLQRIVKLSFYRAALNSGIEKPVWGALTGIRPGKLLSNLLETGMSDRAGLSKFLRDNYVSPERALLCLHTAHAGLNCAKSLEKKDVCLYVGIPFCPTRCSYCSFVSQSTQKSMKMIPQFLNALYLEIEATANVVHDAGLRIVSVYMGGGTPTTLSAQQLDELCEKLETSFELNAVREYTVEAGRPDTITKEKLEALKRHGVTRVSVNPQTMEDAVLEAIGRKHTARDVINALEIVRSVGGFVVNMDLIAGLPLDTPESFKKTLNTVLGLSPENITVHTLALKKGSDILLGNTPRPSAEDVHKMIDFANSLLYSENFEPYYLYRQKYMSGGFENVGWQLGSTENIYNICIMEELCSIISIGGGASTKLCVGNGRIERIFNPKYPTEYIESIDKIIIDKKNIKEILSQTNLPYQNKSIILEE